MLVADLEKRNGVAVAPFDCVNMALLTRTVNMALLTDKVRHTHLYSCIWSLNLTHVAIFRALSDNPIANPPSRYPCDDPKLNTTIVAAIMTVLELETSDAISYLVCPWQCTHIHFIACAASACFLPLFVMTQLVSCLFL